MHDKQARQRPPEAVIGLTPRFIWLEQRRDDVYEAIARRRQAALATPLEWLEENLVKILTGRNAPEAIA